MVEEIIEGIPYAFGDPSTADDLVTSRPRLWSDALRILWSLQLVTWSPLTLPHQTDVARAALKRIGYGMWIRKALIEYRPKQ